MTSTYSTPTTGSPLRYADADGDYASVKPANGKTDTAYLDTASVGAFIPQADVARVALALLESAGVNRYGDGALSSAARELRGKINTDELRAKLAARRAEREKAEADRKAAEDFELDKLADSLRIAHTGLPASACLPWSCVSPSGKSRWRGVARAAKAAEDAKKSDAATAPRFTLEKRADDRMVISDHEKQTGARFGYHATPPSYLVEAVREMNNGREHILSWEAADYVTRAGTAPAPRYFLGRTPSGSYAIMDRRERKAAVFGLTSSDRRHAERFTAELNSGKDVFLLWDSSRYSSRPVS